MAQEKAIEFTNLASGTELETPIGVGKFVAYKKGNFKKQNVLIEHTPCKLKWYAEGELRLVNTKKSLHTAREANQQAFIKDFFYYAI